MWRGIRYVGQRHWTRILARVTGVAQAIVSGMPRTVLVAMVSRAGGGGSWAWAGLESSAGGFEKSTTNEASVKKQRRYVINIVRCCGELRDYIPAMLDSRCERRIPASLF